ncbi:MAG: 3-phosphoglycerate dehydrogenase [Thermoprotei archaeon ex4572_64]|nr:MAG: 3-phosphoglycerate dehydrogenase [Thermoprotei archaeon ex4572_64]
MGTYRVLITDNVDSFVIDELRKAGLDVDYKPGISRDELLRVISNYNILVVRSRTKVTKEVIDQAVSLKLIARIGVGLDNIDINYAKNKNIEVINTPEGPTESVAELTIGLMICAARYITLFDKLVKSGEWPKGKYVGFELMGKTLGVIGFGRIGTRVSEIARSLGMHVLAYDIIDITEKARRIGVEPMKDMYELLSKSDIVSLHVPLTKETYHMISYREFEVMKKGVIIVNTSRGEVIDTKALLDALKSGKVAAAALDVLEHEPPKEPWEIELVNHSRVIITPHVGSETIEARRRNAELLVTKILNHLGLSK